MRPAPPAPTHPAPLQLLRPCRKARPPRPAARPLQSHLHPSVGARAARVAGADAQRVGGQRRRGAERGQELGNEAAVCVQPPFEVPAGMGYATLLARDAAAMGASCCWVVFCDPAGLQPSKPPVCQCTPPLAGP